MKKKQNNTNMLLTLLVRQNNDINYSSIHRETEYGTAL